MWSLAPKRSDLGQDARRASPTADERPQPPIRSTRAPAIRARVISACFTGKTKSCSPQITRIGRLSPRGAAAKLGRPSAEKFAESRLKCLANNLSDKPYLDGLAFIAGDLMMTTVLRIMPELTNKEPRLTAYV